MGLLGLRSHVTHMEWRQVVVENLLWRWAGQAAPVSAAAAAVPACTETEAVCLLTMACGRQH